MRNSAGGDTSVHSDGRDHGYRLIVSDLMSLIEHVQASMKLIESVIASESPLGNQEISANVVVLDDVTPRYVRANAALNDCNAGLRSALHVLLDTRASKHGTGESFECGHHPVRFTGRT